MDEVFEFVAGFSIFVWGPVLLVLAVGVALLVRQALREGREVSFWPPKIGSRPSTTIQSGTAEGLGRLDDGQQKGTIRPIKLPTDQVAYLVLTTGDNAGTAWPIKSGQRELQVGRSPSSDIVIGGDFSVSGAHFKIYVHPVSGARSREYQLFIPCLSGYHPHPLYVVCTHFPEESSVQVEAEISPAMPSRDSDGIVAAFRRHFSVVEILIIESDLAKRHVA